MLGSGSLINPPSWREKRDTEKEREIEREREGGEKKKGSTTIGRPSALGQRGKREKNRGEWGEEAKLWQGSFSGYLAGAGSINTLRRVNSVWRARGRATTGINEVHDARLHHGRVHGGDNFEPTHPKSGAICLRALDKTSTAVCYL